MKLDETIKHAKTIILDAFDYQENGNVQAARSQIEKLHDLMHKSEPAAEQPAAEPVHYDQPESRAKADIAAEQPAAEPESSPEIQDHINTVTGQPAKEGAGIVSEPAEPAKKDTGVDEGAGKLPKPDEKSQNSEGSGIT